MEEIKRAAGYIRVSTAEQATKGLSVETQISEIENYAKLHNMRLEEVYIDRGITARKALEKRVDFMRMMKDVESGRINHIIVLRLDRFFRNVYDYHKMMREYLEPNKCDWSAVKEQYTTTTTNGRLMINLRLSIAEQECDTDSDRIKDVFANRIKNGFAISTSLPFGFKVVDHRVVIDEEKRAIVNDLINHVELCCSVRGTSKYAKEVYNLSFCYESLCRLFKNSLLYGSYRGNDNYCEAYMTKERFDNLRRLLSRNVRQRKNSSTTFIFTGLLACDECNYRLTARHDPKQNYYRCPNHYSHFRCNNRGFVNESRLEKELFDNIKSLIKEHILGTENENREKKAIKGNRKTIEKKLQKLNDLYVNDFISMDKYKEEYELLQSQIIDDTPIQTNNISFLEEFLESDYAVSYHTMTPEQKRALWRSIIKEIRIRNGKMVSVIFLNGSTD